MTRPRTPDALTLDLFEIPQPAPAAEGALNFAVELRHLLSRMLKACPRSRYEVAARMSELLGADISKYQLDAWTAESREPWRFPLEYAIALEVACESHALTEWLAAKRGGLVLWGKEALRAQLGQLELTHDQAARRIREIKRTMGETP